MLTTLNVINLVEEDSDGINGTAGGSNDGAESGVGSSPSTPHNIPLIIDENNGNCSPLLSQQITKKKAGNTISGGGSSSGKLQFGNKYCN